MLKTIKPDANDAFPIINDYDLDNKIIVVVDEYNDWKAKTISMRE